MLNLAEVSSRYGSQALDRIPDKWVRLAYKRSQNLGTATFTKDKTEEAVTGCLQ